MSSSLHANLSEPRLSPCVEFHLLTYKRDAVCRVEITSQIRSSLSLGTWSQTLNASAAMSRKPLEGSDVM